jgi:threonine dehydrogenase-like Zn-dependent dehydrogenase
VRQARWTADGLEVVETRPPALPAGWVRLRVAACGICGTDLHQYHREVPVAPGGVPGHEIAGTVLEGPAGLADSLYAVEPLSWCGVCDLCQSGRRHLCRRLRILGIIGAPGGLAEFVDVPRATLHAVDPSIPPRVASFAEPLAVCVRAVHLARLETRSRVLVLGGGSVGLVTGLLARDRAREVAVVTRHPQQVEAARRLGVEPLDEGAVAAWAAEREPEVVIETVGGRADTLETAVALARRAGRVVVVGVFSEPRPVNLLALVLKELEVVGSNTYGQDRRGPEFAAAVELLPRLRSELAGLQTHAFPLESVGEAFACAADKRSGAIKVTIEP